MKHIWISVLAMAISFQALAWQQNTKENTDTTAQINQDSVVFQLQADDPILMQLEKLLLMPFEQKNKHAFNADVLNKYGFCEDSVPKYNDSTIFARLQLLNEQTPFNLVYNSNVRGFINLYAERKRELTSRVLGLSHLYFPLFEEILDKYDLPLELKYLAVVESALNPRAKSKAGATGLWQFMYQTGRMYNLEVSTYVDDRQDPIKATEAACKYFQYLYGLYGNWELVLAAYNCGPGNVNKAIRKAGGPRDFWEIFKHLPLETRGYVPAFIAVNYVMNYAAEHNLFPIKPSMVFYDYDTVLVNTQLYFDQIAVTLDIDMQIMEDLNPQYKRNIIPYTGKPQVLRLPKEKVGLFVLNEELIQTYKLPDYRIQEIAQVSASSTPTPTSTNVEREITHVVKSGDYLGKIAAQYNVSVKSLMEWNNLKSANLKAGQKLVVYTRAPGKGGTPVKPLQDDTKTIYYSVKPGDSLYSIAKKQGVTIDQLKQWNKNINAQNLKVGNKIIVQKAG